MRRWLTPLALFLLGAPPAFAAADVIVTVVGGAGQASAVTLVGPGGATQEAVDDDRDGLLVLTPAAAGEHRITVALGERQASGVVTVPGAGGVNVLYDPRADDGQISVTYAGGTERIVVTARRREEDIQTIPVSIAAFTADALEERGMEDASDLADFTPNLEFSVTNPFGGSSSEATIYIRGIGQISVELFSDPGVGIYVDGVYLARSQGAVFDLVDLERAEVLRGPQGTLFGKNTIGGAINLVTRKPHAGFEGEVSLGAGDFDRLEGDLHLNLPLGERSWGSLALASRSSDGVTESLQTGEDYFDDNRDAGRLALRFLPTDHVSLDFSADFTRERERATDVTLLGVDETVPILNFYNTVTRAAGFPAYDEQWVTGNLRHSYSSDPSFSDGDVAGAAFNLAWTRGDLEVRSITAYREVEYDVSNDIDGSPIRFAYRPTLKQQDQLSQELQVLGAGGRLDWVLGGLYFDESSHERAAGGALLGGLFEALEAAPGPIFAPPGLPSFLCNPGPPPPGLPCFGGAGNPFNFAFFVDPEVVNLIDLTTTSWALFTETNWAASDRLKLTAGVRYTFEEKDFSLVDIPTAFNPVGLTLYNEDDWDAVTPRLAAAFQAKPNVLVFGSVAKGFKSGGFNGLRGGNTSTLLAPYDPEELWAWELGFKSDAYDNRLRLNGSVFFNDYTDLQLTASLIDDGGQVATVIENAGEAEVLGFELEMVARPTDSFELTAGVGHADAEYTSINEGVQAITFDDTIPKTPEWSFVFSPSYSYRRAGGGSLNLRADYSYKSKTYNDVANNEAAAQGAFGLLGARASYLLPSGSWELVLWGKNLSDEEYLEHALVPEAFGPQIGISGRPREWGGTVRYRF